MTSDYVEVLTKCKECGEHFSRLQSLKCPHKFTDKFTQRMAEDKGKQKEVLAGREGVV